MFLTNFPSIYMLTWGQKSTNNLSTLMWPCFHVCFQIKKIRKCCERTTTDVSTLASWEHCLKSQTISGRKCSKLYFVCIQGEDRFRQLYSLNEAGSYFKKLHYFIKTEPIRKGQQPYFQNWFQPQRILSMEVNSIKMAGGEVSVWIFPQSNPTNHKKRPDDGFYEWMFDWCECIEALTPAHVGYRGSILVSQEYTTSPPLLTVFREDHNHRVCAPVHTSCPHYNYTWYK